MTATAQAPFGLEVANSDAMDLLSDSGYTLGDRDIDVDLTSTNGDQDQQDEVLSLQDAGTDGGTQDDLMIDEDEIDYNDLELEDAAQNSPTNSDIVTAATADHSALVETVQEVTEVEEQGDDLIDYSDVEDDTGEQNNATADTLPTTGHYDPTGDDSGTADEQNLAPPTSVEQQSQEDNMYQYQGDEQHFDNVEQLPNDALNTDWQHVDEDGHEGHHEEQNASREDQQAVEDDESYQHPDHLSEQSIQQITNSKREDKAAFDSEHKSEAEIDREYATEPEQGHTLHPVTINYDGTELWLFKPHNNDEEGEWLLSDESLATKEFPYLFHACRAILGDDISGETELGLRFENFPGLELFEDCTACAYTTLKELLDCYLSLHAQDGNTDPEPFYISLQFRPRVLTLVNELKKAASDQIGFSGFNNAVASGNSSFTPAYSDAHTGAYSDNWQEEERGDGDEGQQENERAEDAPQSNAQEPQQGHSESHSEREDQSPVVTAQVGEQDEPVGTEALSVRSRSASHEEVIDDIIDYSDEEDAADNAQPAQNLANGSSSASSTVQGDEIRQEDDGVGDDTNPIETHDETKSDHDQESSGQSNVHEQDPTESLGVQYDGDGAHNVAYPHVEAFDEAFDQHFDNDNPAQGQDVGVHSAYKADGASYDDHWDGIGDEEPIPEFEDFEQNAASADDGTTGVDDFLDLTGGDEDSTHVDPSAFRNDAVEDEIGYDDDEDVPEPASATTSAAVPTTVASPNGLRYQSSPLVQKRPIDEVDFSVEDSSDATDAKRTKL